MKLAHYFVALLFILVLSACSDGVQSAAVLPDSITAIERPVVVASPKPEVVKPATPVVCDLTTYVPCGGTPLPPPVVNEICNFDTYVPCYALPPTCDENHILVKGICEVKVTYCAQNSDNRCPIAITALPPHRVTIATPSPAPTCVRDSNPLILVDGVLTDNCGNKYGGTV
jgi:hypothetical protein